MYCPRCAAQNQDESKFCRACGTDLEAVALALSAKPPAAQRPGKSKKKPEKTWIEKRTEGAKSIVYGAILLTLSLLIGVAMGLFSNEDDWIIIWLIFVGWLAAWGAFALAEGIGAIIESKLMQRQINEQSTPLSLKPSDYRVSAIDEKPEIIEALPLQPAQSVTEHTTEPLGQKKRSPKQVT
jgi:hypothetical protein